MKNTVYFLCFVLIFVFTSCSWFVTDVEIKEQTYFIELIDSVQSNKSKKVIEDVHSSLQNKAFVLSLENNDWQGIKPYDDKVDLSNLNAYYPEIHTFQALENESKVQEYNVKIKLTYQKQLDDSIPNIRVNMYVRSSDNKNWNQFANPGDFRFNADYYKENKQAEWIKRTLVGLTFK